MQYFIIYLSVLLLFIISRYLFYNKMTANCSDSTYIIPKRTYFWHVSGSLLVMILMSFILYINTSIGIHTFFPNWLFSLMISLVAGICAYISVVYFFSNIGIYKNGILTHFVFINTYEIECYELTCDNTLNINSNIRTLVIHLKRKSVKNPSFEYLVKDEQSIKQALYTLNIKEINTRKEK